MTHFLPVYIDTSENRIKPRRQLEPIFLFHFSSNFIVRFAANAERHWMTSHPILFSSFDYNTIKSSGTTNIRVIIPQGRNQNLSI